MPATTAKCATIAWIDIEGTDVNWDVAEMLEIAIVITDSAYKFLGSFQACVKHDQSIKSRLSKWCAMHHCATIAPDRSMSLVDECILHGMDLGKIDQCAQEIVTRWSSPDLLVVVGGSNLVYDRIMIRKYLPLLNARLHYHNIDVSSMLEIVERSHPMLNADKPKPTITHRAMADIESSLNLQRFYETSVFCAADKEAQSKNGGFTVRGGTTYYSNRVTQAYHHTQPHRHSGRTAVTDATTIVPLADMRDVFLSHFQRNIHATTQHSKTTKNFTTA